MSSKPPVFIHVILVFCGLIAWWLYFRPYSSQDSVSIHRFPKDIGEWKGQDIPFREEDYQLLETRNAFTRIYKKSNGDFVYLFIVYSQDNRKVSHPPEICYTGSGATVISRKPVTIKMPDGQDLRATKMLLEQGDTKQVAIYWYLAGEKMTSNYWYQQLIFSINNLAGQPTGSALIRISANVSLDNDEWGFKASDLLADFSRQMVPLIKKYIKS